MFTIEVAAVVDKGRRKTNDDRALVEGNILDGEFYESSTVIPAVVAVCDGCGGYKGGGVAAQTILDELRKYPADSLANQEELALALEECRRQVYAQKEKYPEYSEMCSTIAGCVFAENSVVIFHAGDSRVYRFDGEYFSQLTLDHSKQRMLIDAGILSAQDAKDFREKNVITRCIGRNCKPPEITISNLTICPGETYLICSDGFWGSVTEEEITEALLKNISVGEKAEQLADMALDNGSKDNVTVCLCSRQGDNISASTYETEDYFLD